MTIAPTNAETGLARALKARPVASSIGLTVLLVAVVSGGGLLLPVLLPWLPGYSVTGLSHAFILGVVATALVLALIGALRWWRQAAYTPPSEWRDMRLYLLPVLLLGVPLLAGAKPLSLPVLGLLLAGYLLTGILEESLWRGVILGLLRPLGVWPAVLISSVLFGLGHLGNSLLRGFSVIILLQAFGAAVQGIGLAALRLRTNSIWPLIAMHALHDLALQWGRLPIPLADATVATILAVYGVVILRRRRMADLPAPVLDQRRIVV